MCFCSCSLDETLKPIKDFENRYLISDWGRVISLNHNRRGKIASIRTFFVKNREKKETYKAVLLYKNGKSFMNYIHRLVATYFCKKKEERFDKVNHEDGIKINNQWFNLEWIDASGNMKHAIENGLAKYRPYTKITFDQAEEIRELYKEGKTVKEIKSIFQLNRQTIRNIVNHKTWKTR